MTSTLLQALARTLPSPLGVIRQAWMDRAALAANSGATLREAFVGFAWGNLAAIVLGGAFAQFSFLERSLSRVAVAGYCLPLVVAGPVLVVVLPGDGPKAALAALAVFFTTLLCTLQGLKAANPTSLAVVRSLGGGPGAAFWRVRVPSAWPSVCAGLKIGAPAALLGAVIGEYFGASQGLGAALVQAQSAYQVDRSWAIALVLGLQAGLLYAGASVATRWLTPWAGSEPVSVGAAPPASGAPFFRRLSSSAAFMAWSAVLGIGLWYGALRIFRLDHFFAKTPLDVWSYLFGAGSGPNRTELAAALQTTFVDAGVGFACGAGAAILSAAILMVLPVVEALLLPAVVFLRSVPILAMTPLIVLVFGRGLLAVTVIVSLVVYFPTLIIVLSGLRAAPRAAGDIVAALGGSAAVVVAKVRSGYAVPSLFTAARNAIPAALGGAILAEWLATGTGAGNLLVVASSESRFDTLWAGSTVLIVISAAAYAALGALERAVVARWGAPTS